MFKNDNVFRHIIEEMNLLENNGSTININNSSFQVYLQLNLVFGDNLGLHTILVLSESFRCSFPWRFCLISINDSTNNFTEDHLISRDENNYTADVDHTPTGMSHDVTEECVFNKINSFHVAKN